MAEEQPNPTLATDLPAGSPEASPPTDALSAPDAAPPAFTPPLAAPAAPQVPSQEAGNVPPPPPPPAPADNWMGHNIASVLALLSVVLTFVMFAYFVQVSSQPSQEVASLKEAQVSLSLAMRARDNTAEGSPERIKAQKEFELAQANFEAAKLVMQEIKDQKGVTKDFVLYILGVLSSTITTVFSYYFGSSRSSSKKDEMINEMARSARTSAGA